VVPVRAGGGLVATREVRSGGTGWFAVAVPSAKEHTIIRVYRLRAGRWRLDGSIGVPQTPGVGHHGLLEVAFLSGSQAPDFTLTTGGIADTNWFVVVSRAGGRWQEVPFESGDGLSVVINGQGTFGRLVRSEVDATSSAEGPTTFLWYRYAHGLFVPTAPPAPVPCTARALDRSRPLPGGFLAGSEHGPREPWSARDLARPLSVSRLACADGWAVASARSAGRSVLGLYENEVDRESSRSPHATHRWLRVALGTPAQVGDSGMFALPHPILGQLAAHVGVLLPPPSPREPAFRASREYEEPPKPDEAAAVDVSASPGSTYAGSPVITTHSGRWFVTAIEWKPVAGRREAVVTAHVYRWSGRSWIARYACAIRLYGAQAAASWTMEPEGVIGVSAELESVAGEEQRVPVTGAGTTDVYLGTGGSLGEPGEKKQGEGRWLAVISDAGDHWHLIPFENNGHTTYSIAATATGRGEVRTEGNHGDVIRYQFTDGRFLRVPAT
jgi:hypothetical protein